MEILVLKSVANHKHLELIKCEGKQKKLYSCEELSKAGHQFICQLKWLMSLPVWHATSCVSNLCSCWKWMQTSHLMDKLSLLLTPQLFACPVR